MLERVGWLQDLFNHPTFDRVEFKGVIGSFQTRSSFPLILRPFFSVYMQRRDVPRRFFSFSFGAPFFDVLVMSATLLALASGFLFPLSSAVTSFQGQSPLLYCGLLLSLTPAGFI